MARMIVMRLNVAVPDGDMRSIPEIIGEIEAALEAGPDDSICKLEIETLHAEIAAEDEPTTIYTVHPFDNEWTWDTTTSGSHPWATRSLREAIDHANLIRLEYASVDEVDEESIAGFWSAIYLEHPDSPDHAEKMFGWVDPQGNFTQGTTPPADLGSNWNREE